MRKPTALAAAALTAILTLTACQPGQGPAGTVIDRDSTFWSKTQQTTYELTVRKPDGAEAEFRVTRSVYQACGDGAAYPACAGV
ncbi:hypothetical protein ACWCQZ_44310 [Streptomyces sp. NPDC002285]